MPDELLNFCGSSLHELTYYAKAEECLISPNHKYIFLFVRSGVAPNYPLRVHRLQDGNQVGSWQGDGFYFSPDSSHVMIRSGIESNHTFAFYRLEDGSQAGSWQGKTYNFSPDSSHVMIKSGIESNYTFTFHRLEDGKQIGSWKGNEYSFSPDNSHVAIKSGIEPNYTFTFYRLLDSKQIGSWQGNAADYSPDNSYVAIKSGIGPNDTFTFHRLEDGKQIKSWQGNGFYYSPDSSHVMIQSRNEQSDRFAVYRLRDGEQVGSWPGNTFDFYPDNQSIIIGRFENPANRTYTFYDLKGKQQCEKSGKNGRFLTNQYAILYSGAAPHFKIELCDSSGKTLHEWNNISFATHIPEKPFLLLRFGEGPLYTRSLVCLSDRSTIGTWQDSTPQHDLKNYVLTDNKKLRAIQTKEGIELYNIATGNKIYTYAGAGTLEKLTDKAMIIKEENQRVVHVFDPDLTIDQALVLDFMESVTQHLNESHRSMLKRKAAADIKSLSEPLKESYETQLGFDLKKQAPIKLLDIVKQWKLPREEFKEFLKIFITFTPIVQQSLITKYNWVDLHRLLAAAHKNWPQEFPQQADGNYFIDPFMQMEQGAVVKEKVENEQNEATPSLSCAAGSSSSSSAKTTAKK